MGMLNGKAALITGSTAGLGLAVARALAEAGASVMLHGLAPRAEGDKVAAELAGTCATKVAFSDADLTKTAEIEALADECAARWGGIDILVNNAVTRHFHPIEAFPAEDWDRSIAVNLSAAFHLTRLAVPFMKARHWGRIVNMSSIYGSRGAENRIDYVTTKTALLGLTRASAIELARTGITCNAVCPGTVPSPAILERIAAIAAERGISHADAEAGYLAERNPTRRFVSAEKVGHLVRFLCSPSGDDITGATLPVDGGWLAK